MFCPRCGRSCPNKSSFCPGCGYSFSPKNDMSKFKENIPEFKGNSKSNRQTNKNKSHKIVIIIGCILIVAIGGGSYGFYRYWTSPQQVISREISSNNYKSAVREFNRNYDEDDKIPSSILSDLTKALEDDYSAFKDGSKSYTEVTKDIDYIAKIKNEDINDKIVEIRSSVDALNASQTAYESGNDFYKSQKYEEAIAQYKEVVKDDKNYDDAQTKLEDSVSKYRSEILDSAKKKAESDDISGAITILNGGLSVLKNDSELTKMLNQYNSEQKSDEISDALDKAESEANDKDYRSAMQTVEAAMKSYPDDTELKSKYDNYKSEYGKDVIAKADEDIANNDYESAIAKLQTASSILPDNKEIADKLSKTQAEKPIPLSDLKSQNADLFEFTDNSVEDVQGNLYSGNNILMKNCDGWYGDGGDAFIEFYCGGSYSTFSFTLAPDTDFESDSAITIEVYTDDNQKKAIKVTQKMEATQVTVDITGCQWLQLKSSAIDSISDYHTWCILDNPVVKK